MWLTILSLLADPAAAVAGPIITAVAVTLKENKNVGQKVKINAQRLLCFTIEHVTAINYL